MTKCLFISACILLLCHSLMGRTLTDEEARSAWNDLRKRNVTEENFKQTCDLIQDVAQTNISISYEILGQYFPMVKATGNHQWTHVLLMNWARAKESLNTFDEADSLYKEARANGLANLRNYDEALVGTVLMYLEWDK